MPGDFVHLHLHSQYSLLDGANKLPELCKRIAELGMPAVAVTDHGNMFGAFHFFHEALQQGVRPIIGVEAYIAPADRQNRDAQAASESGEGYAYHLTLLAANQKGYRNLVRLVSEAYLTGFYHRPRMDKALLREHAEGLIGLSGCLKGEVAGALSRGNYAAAKAAFLEYQDIFGKGNFYVEIMDHGLPQQTAIVPDLLRLSTETGAPAVATNDSHYLRRDDAFPHEVLLCIGMGKTLEDERRMRFYNDEFYVKDPDEMKARFRPWSVEAVTNTVAIAERCAVSFDTEGLHLPTFSAPDGRPPVDYFRDLAAEGLERRLTERAAGRRGADSARKVPGTPGLRDRRHREDGVPVVLPDRVRLHPLCAGAGNRGGPRPGQRRGLDRLVGAPHHGDRPARVRPALRAFPQPRADLDARHRHRLLPGAAGRGHRVRHQDATGARTSPRS